MPYLCSYGGGENVQNTPRDNRKQKKEKYTNEFCNTEEKIYNLLVSSESFTIKGIVIEIKKEEEVVNNNNGSQIAEKVEKTTTINVLNKEIFDNAVVELIKSFVAEEDYIDYMNSEQEEIVDMCKQFKLGNTSILSETLLETAGACVCMHHCGFGLQPVSFDPHG